jgi:transposase
VYLVQYQLLPYARVSETLSDLLGICLSPGTVQTLVQQCYQQLADVEQQIKTALQQAPVIHQDETGMFVNGKCQWMHVCSTKSLTRLRGACQTWERGHGRHWHCDSVSWDECA